jgi:hypothetical protein
MYQDFYTSFLKGIYPTELSREDKSNFFMSSCEEGHLEVAQWLWSISKETIDIHVRCEYVFRLSCGYGHLDVAQWLWSISNETIDLHASIELAFRMSCRNGYLEVAQWLSSIYYRHTIYKIDKKTSYSQNIGEIIIYHIKHHYYKPYTGPGYLRAIRED